MYMNYHSAAAVLIYFSIFYLSIYSLFKYVYCKFKSKLICLLRFQVLTTQVFFMECCIKVGRDTLLGIFFTLQ